jgi:ADP-ribose pyrophosphatase
VTEHERKPEENPSVAGKISSRRAYTGRVVSLDVDKVRFPNGTEGELEMIRHSGASAVVPLLDMPDGEKRVILIRQYRYAAEGYVYEVPAGRLDEGESPEACAHRELKEETGYSATRMIPLTTIFTTPGFTDEKIHLFLATDLTPGQAKLEADEVLDTHPVPLPEALEMIRSGVICDGKTISALLFAARFSGIE